MFGLTLVGSQYEAVPSDYRVARRVPAWLMSVALHTCLLVLAALLVRSPTKGPSVEADRTAGIALVQRTQSETTYFTEEDVASTSSAVATSATDSSSQPSPLAELPIALAIQLPSSAEISSSTGLGQVLPGAIGFTTGSEGARGLPGGQARTQVFGAEGTGNKFVYVFDRSASMDGFQGRPMAAAKSQLTASLEDLESVHQFQIVFYNEKPAVFHPDRSRPPSILFASDENKRLATSFVKRMTAIGGTRHIDALNLALGMSPDVVFFLTDAAEPQLTPAELAQIRRRNRSEATINSIEFGSGPRPRSENFLMRLARQNRGKHVYVDVSKLP
ncbi:MAG: hypothetical protein H8E66_13620 [Planctomycetes bacterium]|nr:hypothetical protein [Planctomycetota bacterium]